MDSQLAAALKEFHHESGYVRLGGVRKLGEIGAPEVIPYLVEALEDEDETVRHDAAFILGKLGDPRAVPHLKKRLLDQGIDALRYGPPSYVAECAAYALKAIGTAESMAAFLEWPNLLLHELDVDDASRIWGSILMLGRLKESQAVPRLVELLHGGIQRIVESDAEAQEWGSREEVKGWLMDITIEALTQIGTSEALTAVETWRRSET